MLISTMVVTDNGGRERLVNSIDMTGKVDGLSIGDSYSFTRDGWTLEVFLTLVSY